MLWSERLGELREGGELVREEIVGRERNSRSRKIGGILGRVSRSRRGRRSWGKHFGISDGLGRILSIESGCSRRGCDIS